MPLASGEQGIAVQAGNSALLNVTNLNRDNLIFRLAGWAGEGDRVWLAHWLENKAAESIKSAFLLVRCFALVTGPVDDLQPLRCTALDHALTSSLPNSSAPLTVTRLAQRSEPKGLNQILSASLCEAPPDRECHAARVR